MAVKIWPRVAETAKITLFRYQRPKGAEFQAFTMLPHSNWLGHSDARRSRICPLGLTAVPSIQISGNTTTATAIATRA